MSSLTRLPIYRNPLTTPKPAGSNPAEVEEILADHIASHEHVCLYISAPGFTASVMGYISKDDCSAGNYFLRSPDQESRILFSIGSIKRMGAKIIFLKS